MKTITMDESKDKRISRMEHALENVSQDRGASIEFKKQLLHKLSKSEPKARIVSIRTVMAIAASFTLLLLTNIWVLQENSKATDPSSGYSEIISSYDLQPTTLTKSFRL